MARFSDETVQEALDKIARREYVLPAIQRDFVWRPEQICTLFDSVMRDYPFGSLLYWRVERENHDSYRFYDFVLNYHQLDAPRCPAHRNLPAEPRIAVLDGQQRLTALNVGLRGTYAERSKYKPKNKILSYPVKALYLDIAAEVGEHDDRHEGLAFRFEFLVDDEATKRTEAGAGHWFRVSDAMDFHADSAAPEINDLVRTAGLAENQWAFNTLFKLYEVVHRERVISYFEERRQDLDRVLDIFIRVNSQGETLSQSDLLMSVATAQWSPENDAREQIPATVSRVNEVGRGFSFNRDNVLKAGLMLTGADVRFQARNFTQDTMSRLEAEWQPITRRLILAVELLHRFGLSGETITANNVLLPIAYYLSRRDLDDSYLTHQAHNDDRARVQDWTLRALLMPGIWGSAVDTLLTDLRATLRDRGEREFPSDDLHRVMAARNKGLRFSDEVIEALVDTRYGRPSVTPMLSLVYGRTINYAGEFHVDHIFPQRVLQRSNLKDAGYSADEADFIVREHRDGLANLQLLSSADNIGKRDKLPLAWARQQFATERELENYLVTNDMVDLPEDLGGFLEFFAARRQRLVERLRDLLGRVPGDAESPEHPADA